MRSMLHRVRGLSLAAAVGLASVLLLTPAAAMAAPTEDAWLTALQDRVIADAAAGKPLVVQAHVPLCEASIIRCGGHGLGDGDDPKRNLYWATSEGFVGWFAKRSKAWRLALRTDGKALGLPDVIEVRVWRRDVTTSADWRRRGAPATLPVYVVAMAWRGKAIDASLAAYARDLYGAETRKIQLSDGTVLDAGGSAQIVAYVGHNRLMDLSGYDWTKAGGAAADAPAPPAKGAIAIACHTAAYMKEAVPAPGRVPLLFTADFLMASAPTLDGSVSAFAAGGDFRAIRRGAAQGYADGSGKPYRRVEGAFTNPSDRRWRK